MDDKAVSFLMFRALRGVMRRAENGDLPLFARTLGLPPEQYCTMMAHYFPEYPAGDELLPPSYALLQACRPDDFSSVLANVLNDSLELDQQQPQLWLAHAVASAAYGEQVLWQSMELANVHQLHQLLLYYFPQCDVIKQGVSSWQVSLFNCV